MIQYIQEYNKIFWNFISKYDTSNTNILRKIIHSFDVATTSFKIACKLKLCQKDRIFAYLVGLLHDVGRFEQWKKYQTYNDNNSADHGDLSYEVLKTWDGQTLYLDETQFDILCETAKYHNKPYNGENEDVLKFVEIVKNADSFSNVITTANGAQQIFIDKDGFTKEIYDKFISLQPIYYYSPQTKLDRSLILTSCAYNITFDFLRKDVLNNNYLDAIYDTFSKYLNEEDKALYKEAVEILRRKL